MNRYIDCAKARTTAGLLAIAYLGSNGIGSQYCLDHDALRLLHRDIQPSNILVSGLDSLITQSSTSSEAVRAISDAARVVLGERGLERLHSFADLLKGWDGDEALPLNEDSVRTFSAFFGDTALNPGDASVFMSHRGNVAASWNRQSDGSSVELEFHPDGIAYFFENEDLEGFFPRSDIGVTGLFNLLQGHAYS